MPNNRYLHLHKTNPYHWNTSSHKLLASSRTFRLLHHKSSHDYINSILQHHKSLLHQIHSLSNRNYHINKISITQISVRSLLVLSARHSLTLHIVQIPLYMYQHLGISTLAISTHCSCTMPSHDAPAYIMTS